MWKLFTKLLGTVPVTHNGKKYPSKETALTAWRRRPLPVALGAGGRLCKKARRCGRRALAGID
jgi:hypothetical protein